MDEREWSAREERARDAAAAAAAKVLWDAYAIAGSGHGIARAAVRAYLDALRDPTPTSTPERQSGEETR